MKNDRVELQLKIKSEIYAESKEKIWLPFRTELRRKIILELYEEFREDLRTEINSMINEKH